MTRRLLCVLMVFAVCAVLGCGEDQQTRILKAYERDVAEALQVVVPDISVTILPYPQKRDLYLEPLPYTISFTDFLALNECGLRQLIAQRNDQLGKVMPMSRLLVYEHNLLKQATRCRAQVSVDHPLANKLDEIIDVKTQNLPIVFWNATFASNAFRNPFSLATSGSDNPFPESIARALGYFVHLHDRFGKVDQEVLLSEVEGAYEAIETKGSGGFLMLSVAQMIETLERVNQMIDTRLQRGNLILNSVEANKLRQAFDMYYIKHVQPGLSQTHNDARGWFEYMNALVEVQGEIMPDAFRDYYRVQLDMTSKTGLWQRFEGAIQSHTNVWQQVLDQTGGMPER